MKKEQNFKQDLHIIFIGFMRLITLNFKLWCKPTEKGWK